MAKYRVKTTCYFQERFLKEGDVVEFGADVKVPRHLEPLGKAPQADAEKPKAKEPNTMHDMAKLKPKTSDEALDGKK